MAMNRESEPNGNEHLVNLMRGIVALLAADREDRVARDADVRRPEPILSAAGLSISEIAEVTGKKYETVKTILRRTRSSKAGARDAG
jgi:hypothetical protein